MGTCFSKKAPSSSSSSSKVAVSATAPDPTVFSPHPQPVEEVGIKEKPTEREEEARAAKEEESSVKEMHVTKHRKSHDRAPHQQYKVPDGVASGSIATGTTVSSSHESEEVGKNVITSTVSSSHTGVRTSSCTKEEVDAILIQCGRLSHNTPSKAASGSAERSRKYSGSKRSYDFDLDHNGADDYCDDNDGAAEDRRHRERNRQSRASPQGRRRRTPSREREEQSQRSNSKERGSGSRRVSRSPGRRSSNSSTTSNVADPSVSANGRPGKMVSVPASVSSLATDKSNNGCGEPAVAATSAVKRISVKRNAGEAGTLGSRSAASPRAQSPARIHASGTNENVRARSPARTNASGSSRKAEQSPYRRNPLSEIDPNSLANSSNRVHIKREEFEADGQKLANHKTSKVVSCPAKEHQQQQILEEAKGQTQMTRNVTVTAVPKTFTRSRSSRKSQDLDLNQESILNANPSYTSLLLEDIQNFHQKSTLNPASILEAVADLNCGTGSNLSCTVSEERMGLPTDQFSRTKHSLPSATILAGKKRAQQKEAFVESEVIVGDDLMEPSLHKYVTMRRGGRELEVEESSGSNSIAAGGGGQQGGVSSSSWEPNSADSTDRWTSRRDFDHQQQTGIGRGKFGGNRGLQAVVVAAST